MLTIFDEPKVTLLAYQKFENPLEGEWETDAPSDGEALAEFAGRLCYLSFGEVAGLGENHKTVKGRTGNAPYLDNIITVKHGSVLEHVVHSFLFEQISRSLTHELVRHRAGMAYSQLSQRYVDESQVAFIRPPDVAPNTFADEVFTYSCEQSLQNYERLLYATMEMIEKEDTPESLTQKKKRARQTARALLPNATETKIVATGNARAWRHFLEMRGSLGADREIRALAVAVAQQLCASAPNIFADCEIVTLSDGTLGVHLEHSKV